MQSFKQKAHIDQWYVVEGHSGQYLRGIVSGHPRQRESWNGVEIHTSTLEALNEATGTAETRNTLYTLGAKKETK